MRAEAKPRAKKAVPPNARRSPWFLGLLAAAYVVVLLQMAAPHGMAPTFGAFFAQWSGLFLLYGLAVAVVRRCPTPDTLYVPLLVAAAAVRLPLLAAAPFLSDDIFRYAWDAHVLGHGINPFAYAPNADALRHLITPWHVSVNHPHVITVYPPVAQALFALAYAAHPTVNALKLVVTCFDFACIPLLGALLHNRGRPKAYSVVYALCPLAVLETSWSGHVDAIAVFFMLLALCLYEKRRETGGHLALSAAILTKFFPLVLLPAVFQRVRSKAGILWVPLVTAAAFLPFASAGPRLVSGLLEYGEKWSFNAFLFTLLARVLPNPLLSRLAAGALFAAVILWCAWRRHAVARSGFVITAAWLALTTTVHPWYLLWILPFLCLFPSRGHLYLTYAIGLSYAARFSLIRTGDWHLHAGIWWLEYLPFSLLIARDLIAARRRRSLHGPARPMEGPPSAAAPAEPDLIRRSSTRSQTL